MVRAGTAVLGGTFDRLHVGHEALLRTAFRAARSVAIGLTSDDYLRRHPKPGADRIQSYASRRRALLRWLAREFPARAWRVVPLGDGMGHAVDAGFDAIVVTEETLPGAAQVNAERVRRKLPPLEVVLAPTVLGDDLRAVSSRRIRGGEIDRDGHRGSPIHVAVVLPPKEALAPWRRALRSVFPRGVVRARAIPADEDDLEVRVRSPRGSRPGSISLRSPWIRLRSRPLAVGTTPRQAVALLWPARPRPRRSRKA